MLIIEPNSNQISHPHCLKTITLILSCPQYSCHRNWLSGFVFGLDVFESRLGYRICGRSYLWSCLVSVSKCLKSAYSKILTFRSMFVTVLCLLLSSQWNLRSPNCKRIIRLRTNKSISTTCPLTTVLLRTFSLKFWIKFLYAFLITSLTLYSSVLHFQSYSYRNNRGCAHGM